MHWIKAAIYYASAIFVATFSVASAAAAILNRPQPALWLNDGNGNFAYQHLPLLAGDNHGEASGINNSLYAVGYSGVFVPSNGLVTQSAVLWDPVLGAIDLNDRLCMPNLTKQMLCSTAPRRGMSSRVQSVRTGTP